MKKTSNKSAVYKDYEVTLTLRVHTRVTFQRESEAELATIQKSDAIENAIGLLPDLTDDGFTVAMPIDGEAEESFADSPYLA